MAISHVLERDLDEALQQIENETSIIACYIVDSFGSLYSEDNEHENTDSNDGTRAPVTGGTAE